MSSPKTTPTPPSVDLSNCDREQIQYAGAILAHGALITLSEPALTVLQASVNCMEMLGVSTQELLGQPLETVLDPLQMQTFREQLVRASLSDGPSHLFRGFIQGIEFDVFGHRYDGVLIVEFERRAQEPRGALRLQSELREAFAALQAAPTLQIFLDLAVNEIRKFTGFDRVMAYKFMEDGSGWVRSESLAADMDFPPYLGLHYPASDIPQPARRLFSLTWLRHQPDMGYLPVPMTAAAGERPLDMSCALLRSVSLIYVEYLKNMGTQSSMVMTLMKEGKLWGLIACHHHREPKQVPYETRMACEFLAHMVSLLMSAKEDLENADYKVSLKATERLLVENLSRVKDFGKGLMQRSPTLLDFIRAPGVALVVNGRVEKLGQTPDDEQILSLTKWLAVNMENAIFSTDSLTQHIPEAASYGSLGSGILALRFSRLNNDFVVWFRPEQIETVNWAGDPKKPVDFSDDGQRLKPRLSFALWKETVRLKSHPWSQVEFEAATALRTGILEALLDEAEELGKLYQDMERSHAQLDAFAYIAAHDLKEPLRGINNYTDMLREDYGAELGEEGRSRLATLGRLTQRMDDLLDSLLEYSRVGRTEFVDGEVDLNIVVADAIEVLRPRIKEQQTEIRIATPLPKVMGDRNRLGEVFVNLISNAIKYNDKAVKWVEIGSESMGMGDRQSLFVRDNGIGIRPEHTDQIFQIFRRLHGRNEFGGGSGAGLTITKKIIERHFGRIWVESTPGVGTTFRFSLKPRESV